MLEKLVCSHIHNLIYALLVTKSFPKVVSFVEILPLLSFSTSGNDKSAKP